MMQTTIFLLFQLLSLSYAAVTVLDQNNWGEMMIGEWMVIFHAPWCPACRSTMPSWKTFGETSAAKMIDIGEVDITKSPALTGTFLITQLPTIIHVKDGDIRMYSGGRMPEELEEFVKLKKWTSVDPWPWYYSPNTYHMRAFGLLLRASVFVRDLNSHLTEHYGFPTWLAYVTLGLATLLIGIGFGLICVVICDFCCPPRPQIKLLLGGRQEPPEPGVSSDNDDDSDVIMDDVNGAPNKSSPAESPKPTKSGDIDSAEEEEKKEKKDSENETCDSELRKRQT